MGSRYCEPSSANDKLPQSQKLTVDTLKRSTPANALTHLGCATFKISRSWQAPNAVHVSLRAKAIAFLSLMTGSAFEIRGSDEDARADAESTSTSVGLIAALVLTLVVPLAFDSIYGVQTNAYMVTDPAWVGIIYFFFLTMAAILFAISVGFAILTILVTRQLSTPSEGRYLFTIARAEFIRPVQYLFFGLLTLLIALTLFLIIAFFNLSAVDECEPALPSTSALLSLNVSSDTAQSQGKCRWYPELFIAICCGIGGIGMMALNSATKVCLKP